MKNKSVENIREFVWKTIDTDISIKKDISRNIVNVRKLASYLIKTQKLEASLDSVISAIRRYKSSEIKKDEYESAYEMLKQAKLSIRTQMVSLDLKRTDEVKSQLGRPDKLVEYHEHDTVRVLEGSNTVTLIFDKKNADKIVGYFSRKNILNVVKNVGMLELSYPKNVERTPGLFFLIANELAQNDVSIINALIASSEHIITVDEKDITKAFELIYNLIKK